MSPWGGGIDTKPRTETKCPWGGIHTARGETTRRSSRPGASNGNIQTDLYPTSRQRTHNIWWTRAQASVLFERATQVHSHGSWHVIGLAAKGEVTTGAMHSQTEQLVRWGFRRPLDKCGQRSWQMGSRAMWDVATGRVVWSSACWSQVLCPEPLKRDGRGARGAARPD